MVATWTVLASMSLTPWAPGHESISSTSCTVNPAVDDLGGQGVPHLGRGVTVREVGRSGPAGSGSPEVSETSNT